MALTSFCPSRGHPVPRDVYAWNVLECQAKTRSQPHLKWSPSSVHRKWLPPHPPQSDLPLCYSPPWVSFGTKGPPARDSHSPVCSVLCPPHCSPRLCPGNRPPCVLTASGPGATGSEPRGTTAGVGEVLGTWTLWQAGVPQPSPVSQTSCMPRVGCVLKERALPPRRSARTADLHSGGWFCGRRCS